MVDYAGLVYEIDSTQARGAAKALSDLNSATINVANGFAKFEKTMRDANGRFRSTSEYIAKHSDEIKGLAMAYNPAMAAQIRYSKEAVRTATAVKTGVITEQQRVEILRRLKRELDGTASAERKAHAAREAALREFVPLYAASKDYESTLSRLNAALDAGDISANQHAAALRRINEAYAAGSDASKRFGQAQAVASHHAANLSFQINDIGMMMAMGQNPFMLMIQQGPQVAQIFSAMNAEGRKIGPTIAGAFRMFLNPTTAITLALIGGAAALAQWGKSAFSSAGDGKKFSESISDLENSLSGLGRFSRFDYANNRINVSLSEIVEKYGQINKGVETHIQLLNDAAIASANLSQMNYMSLFTETFDTGWLTTRVDEVRIAFDATNDSARRLIMLMDEAGKAKGLTAQREAAEAVRDYVLDISGGYQNMTSEQLKFAMELNRIVDSLRQMEVSVERTTGNVVESARQTAIWERNMAAVKAQIDAISRSLNAIAGFQIATVSAQLEERLLATGVAAGEAARQVQKFESAASFMDRRKALMAQYSGNYDDPGYKTQIRLLAEEEAAANRAADAQYSLGQTRERLAEEERARRKAESGGKGAAGRAAAEVRAAEKGFQSLRELLERDTLFQFAEYEKRHAQLKAALDKRLVTQQQYQEYESALRIQYFGTEYQQRQLQYDLELQQLRQALEQQLITRQEYDALMRQRQWEQISQLGQIQDAGTAYELNQMASAFGQAASLAGDYNDKFLKAQKIFAASAALISTYQGAAKALELPFPMNMAAAAKVIGAGLGFVSAIKSGGSSRGSGSSSSSSASVATKTEPTRQVLVRLEGDEWLVNMADSIMSEIYKQTKDGRVVIARQY